MIDGKRERDVCRYRNVVAIHGPYMLRLIAGCIQSAVTDDGKGGRRYKNQLGSAI
jgi:hypothetical protein